MYLTYEQFVEQFTPLSSLLGGEVKKAVARSALERAHADLDARLRLRYETPLPYATLPEPTKRLLQRWVYYLTVRELLSAQAVVLSADERAQSFLSDTLELIDEQIESYVQGARTLAGVTARVRTYFGTVGLDAGS